MCLILNNAKAKRLVSIRMLMRQIIMETLIETPYSALRSTFELLRNLQTKQLLIAV